MPREKLSFLHLLFLENEEQPGEKNVAAMLLMLIEAHMPKFSYL